jgi:CRISPR/Cas system CMR-associated protein Cmr5 small subunit
MSVEQSIAALARELVQSQSQPDDPVHEKETAYRALCESFPALLRSAGLAQAITYLEAKKKDHDCGTLLDHFERQFTALNLLDGGKKERLPSKVTSKDFPMPHYRYYSAVAFKVAYWHKRLAQALLRQRAKLGAGARP